MRQLINGAVKACGYQRQLYMYKLCTGDGTRTTKAMEPFVPLGRHSTSLYNATTDRHWQYN